MRDGSDCTKPRVSWVIEAAGSVSAGRIIRLVGPDHLVECACPLASWVGQAHSTGIAGRLCRSQVQVGSPIRLRSDIIVLAWIWHTLDSVTPKTSPISDKVMPS